MRLVGAEEIDRAQRSNFCSAAGYGRIHRDHRADDCTDRKDD
jgi:hypothetical protein